MFFYLAAGSMFFGRSGAACLLFLALLFVAGVILYLVASYRSASLPDRTKEPDEETWSL